MIVSAPAEKKAAFVGALVYGLCFINFLCLFFYQSNNTPLLLLALIGCFSFFVPARNRLSPYACLFFLYLLYLYCADVFLFGMDFSFSRHRRELFAFLAGAALYFAAQRRECFFPLLMNAALVCGALFALVQQLFSVRDFFSVSRLQLYLNHPSLLGSFSAICLISSIYASALRFRNTRIPVPPWYLTVTGFSAFILLVLSFSRTSLFASALVCLPGCAFAGWHLLRNYPRRSLALLCVCLALVCAAWAVTPDTNRHKSAISERIFDVAANPTNAPTFLSRVPGWESAIDGFCQAPYFGHGYERFPGWHVLWVREHYGELRQSFSDSLLQRDTVHFESPHNQYLHTLFEYGLAGACLFVALLLWPLAAAVRARTSYGLLVPLLVYFLIQFTTETPLCGSRMAALGTTLLFMLLGYFSAVSGAGAGLREEPDIATRRS